MITVLNKYLFEFYTLYLYNKFKLTGWFNGQIDPW